MSDLELRVDRVFGLWFDDTIEYLSEQADDLPGPIRRYYDQESVDYDELVKSLQRGLEDHVARTDREAREVFEKGMHEDLERLGLLEHRCALLGHEWVRMPYSATSKSVSPNDEDKAAGLVRVSITLGGTYDCRYCTETYSVDGSDFSKKAADAVNGAPGLAYLGFMPRPWWKKIRFINRVIWVLFGKRV